MKRLKRRMKDVAVTAVAVSGILAAVAGQATPASAKDVKILGLWPMSGPYADLGPLLNRGAEIALDEVGHKINGEKIDYITRDSAAKAGVAARRVQGAIDSDHVQYTAIMKAWTT